AYQQSAHSQTEHLLRKHRIRFLKAYEANFTSGNLRDARRAYINRFFGVNCSISRELFLYFGGFTSSLRHYDEDAELGARLYDGCVRFRFQPLATVEHRDTKNLTDYSMHCWEITGRNHLFRAQKKGQRNPQTAALTMVQFRNPLQRMKIALSWNHPDLLRKAASAFHAITEATGSQLTFRLWCSTVVSAAYWHQVRAQGITLDRLRKMVGWPLPILCFHSISSDKRNYWKYQISPKRFLNIIARL